MTFSVFSGIGHCMPFSGKGVGWRSSFLNANYMRSKGAVESGWCVESSDGDDDCRGAKHVKNKEPPKGAGKITRLKTGNESETMFEEGVEEETGGVKEKCEGEQKEAGATHAMDNRDLPSKEKSGQKREKKKRDGEITGVSSSSSSPSASPKLKKGRTKKGESVKEKEKEEKTEAGAKTKKGGNKKEGDEPLFRFSS